MYYLVAYGHAIRCEKADTPERAMKLAFGIVDADRMTLVQTKSLPRNLATLQSKLAVRHFRRTGSILYGYEKEPGIHNTHHTECELCRIPINTEPASAGIDHASCLSCQAKLDTLNQEEVDALSIPKLREKLGITFHSNPCS